MLKVWLVTFDVYELARVQAELSLAAGHNQSTEGGYHSMGGVSPSTQIEGVDRNKP